MFLRLLYGVIISVLSAVRVQVCLSVCVLFHEGLFVVDCCHFRGLFTCVLGEARFVRW